MFEQFGPIYYQNPSEINAPYNNTYLRLFVNLIDGLAYVKRSNDTIELFSNFIGAVQAQSVTYAQMLVLANSNSLRIGGAYIITDFRTRYIIPNTVVVGIGPIEPLIVIASNVNTIHPEAISSSFPNDEILYELIDSTTSGGDRGRIYTRNDTLINVSAGYNWRVIKFRRWETAPASGIFTVITDNGGAFQDYFTFNDSASAQDCFNTFVGEITEFGINTFNAPTSKLNNNIFNAVCYDNKIDVDSFDNTVNSVTFGGNTILPAFLQNTITGGQTTLNIIGAAFVGNVIGTEFTANNIRFNFFGNQIGDNFLENVIESNFFGNTITNDFQRNVVGQNFAVNIIGDSWKDNVIGSDAQGNIIGMNMSVNQIFTKFQNNVIADNFVSNIIGGAFDSNINIGNDFRYNTITQGLTGVDFAAATHVYGDYTKNIFKNNASVYRLSYVDAADTVIYTAPNA